MLLMLLWQLAATSSLEETGSIESNTNPLSFPCVLKAQGGWSRCCCRVCHSCLATYPRAAHLPYVPEQGVGIGSLESLPHHQCTMLAHFLHFCAKTMLTAFLKLPHFNTGVRQSYGNFYTCLFIQSQLCLILCTTWANRSILSQLQGNFCLSFCWIPWAMVAVPGITWLRSLAWHCWHRAGVQSTTRSKTELTGTEGQGFVFPPEEAVVLTECFMLP